MDAIIDDAQFVSSRKACDIVRHRLRRAGKWHDAIHLGENVCLGTTSASVPASELDRMLAAAVRRLGRAHRG